MQLSRIGEQLPCTREPGTRKDPFAVVRSSVTVTTTTNNQVCTSARTTGLIARSGGRIRLGVANQNPQSGKLFPRNFVKGQSAKNLSLENLALYGMFSTCYETLFCMVMMVVDIQNTILHCIIYV